MFKRKLNYEVVPEENYTDFSDRPKRGNGVLITAATAATASLATYTVTKIKNTNQTTIPTNIPTQYTPPTAIEPTTINEPFNVLTEPSTVPVDFAAGAPEVIQTGVIAETSLNLIATALDPVIQILVAISLPIASVIMIGACFFFMFGQSEKGWSTIMNAGLGYVLINMSPLFLKILREIGNAI